MTVLKKNLDDQVREVLSEDEALEIIEYLSSYDQKLAKNFKARNRNNQERLTSGDPRQLCAVAKGLIRLKRSRKSLSNSDRAQLHRALHLLAEELAAVLDEEPAAMEDKIREVCLDSLAA